MKKLNKKGFTIVELVIVIAVIAILAAVLIPTFSNVVKKANYSNDIQVARNMETSLAVEHVGDNKVENIVKAKEILTQEGYANNFIPKSSGYHYYWCEVDNYVYLVYDKDNAFNVAFPETKTEVTKDNSYRLDLEYYTITYVLTSCSVDESVNKKPIYIQQDCELTITFIKDTTAIKEDTEILWDIPSIDGATQKDWCEDGEYAKLTISNPTDSVTITVKTIESDCLAKGTKITMSNGSQKNIEDIVKGDLILTFNHEKGVFEGQKVYLAWKGKTAKCAFTLHFTNDINISIIGDHCFFEKESLKYVTILESNAEEFIGKHFYNATANRYEELLSVTFSATPVEYYEIYTEYNANCIAENMLNAPMDDSERLNIYTFFEDLTIDHEQLALDIAEFGLFEYSLDAKYSKELYDALGWKYVKIMIGKGFDTWEDFIARLNDFLILEQS